MSATVTRTPIRRSPLHATHEALGARWRSSDALWPTAYGDPVAERAAARTAAALVDAGPLDKYSVKAASPGEALAALGLAFSAGRVVAADAGGAFDVWGVAPDEALLIAIAGATAPVIPDAAVTDLSSGFGALVLAGPRSRSILEELTPIDLAERSFADGAVASIPLANVRVIAARQDRAGVPRFTLLADRDLVEYVWDSLFAIGARHGLVPAGALALGED